MRSVHVFKAVAFKARRLRCPDRSCRHIHAEGMPCPVFVRKTKLNVGGSDSDSDSDSNSDSDSDSGSEEESSEDEDAPESVTKSMAKMGRGALSMAAKAGKGAAAAAGAAGKAAKHTANMAKTIAKNAASGNLNANLRHETPDWARALHYRRCNCLQGVPPNNVAFIPVLPNRNVGGIIINDKGDKPTGGWKVWRRNVRGGPPVDVLRGALPFVNPRSLALASTVCTVWHPEVTAQPHYQDMHRFAPVLQIEVRKHCHLQRGKLVALRSRLHCLHATYRRTAKLFSRALVSVAWRTPQETRESRCGTIKLSRATPPQNVLVTPPNSRKYLKSTRTCTPRAQTEPSGSGPFHSTRRTLNSVGKCGSTTRPSTIWLIGASAR